MLISFGIQTKKEVNQVMKWESTVQEAAKKHGVEEYADLALAIIYTETKGNHLDVMQSSESKYGLQNKIETSEESIDIGVAHLAEVIKLSNQKKCDIWTAIQAYNFGMNYIDYISENGGETTVELAKKYSRDILAPLLGNKDGETYFYKSPLALFYSGGKLYKNGGNYLYAKTVHWNLTLIHAFS